MWLYGSSPLLYRDKLYIEVLQQADPAVYRHAIDDKPKRESFLLCLDPRLGDELWRHLRKTDALGESQDAYTSPLIRQSERGAEIVIFGADYLTSHDPETGAELWRSGSLNARKSDVWRTISSPVSGPEGVFACLPRANSPTVAVRPGDAAAVPVAWRSSEASCDVPSPLYYQGRLFVLNGNQQKLSCIDPKTGVTKWSGRLGAGEVFSASPTGADGKIYCIGEGGTVVVLSAGDKFKVVSRFNMDDEGTQAEPTPNAARKPSSSSESGPILSTIAVANRHLFVRTSQYLYCIGPKQ
jgi:outer membrane protein assembly factor BamB